MKTRLHFIIIALCSIGLNCTVNKEIRSNKSSLSAQELIPYGRYTITTNGLEMISSGMHFGFRFQGKECRILASAQSPNQHNYLQYELDGKYQERIRIDGKQRSILISAPEGSHTVWIYKATEAHTGPIHIEEINGKHLQAIRKPDAPMIEFIGNSITCGAASDPSEVPCGKGEYHDQHNAYYAYGPRVARALGVNFMLSSVSGIGAYRNWNSDGPIMSQVYEKVNFQENNPNRWDFSNYQPVIVSIALGTNDFSHGDGVKARLPFDSTRFVTNYIALVKLVKAKYSNTQIALLSSPMLNGDYRQKLQNCLMAIKHSIDTSYTSSKPLAVYFFKPMLAKGCTGHPSVEDHAELAIQLETFFKNLLER